MSVSCDMKRKTEEWEEKGGKGGIKEKRYNEKEKREWGKGK